MSCWKLSLPLALIFTLARSLVAAPEAVEESKPPRLTVVIIIDQFRGDYLERFGPYFGEGGFKRLVAGGMNFTNCHYDYAMTKTAPGHATILTGVEPSVHGIIGNDWPDKKTFKKLMAVQDDKVLLVGMPEGTPDNELKVGRSPHNLLADTVGDQLKLKYGPSAKVVAVANKDRSAVLPGGKRADIVLWDQDGRYVSSSYYMKELPAWVVKFNAADNIGKLAGTTWDRLGPKELYDKVQGPDDVEGESPIQGMGRVFPKTIPAIGADGSRKELVDAYDFIPAAQTDLATIAHEALVNEGLGKDDVPDLLSIGFSQIDAIGHATGPDSHEVFDSILRLDRVIAQLLTDLDQEVGQGNYTVVMTADHGVGTLPEVAKAKDPNSTAARVEGKAIDLIVQMALNKALGSPGKGAWAVKYTSSYYLNHEKLAEKGLVAEEVEKVIKDTLAPLPFIAEVYTRADLENAPPGRETYLAMARNSYFAEHSPDVSYLVRPLVLESPGNAASHGTPYAYDTYVPQLYYGRGITAGSSAERVLVTSIAPTLSAILQIDPPKGALERNLLAKP